MKKLIAIFCLLGCLQYDLFSQCSPRQTQFCDDAVVVCGLADLDGISCSWPTAWNAAGPFPQVCALGAPPPPAAAPDNMGWWAFTTQGGPATITITTSNCSGTGLEAGVYESCAFINQVACDASCMGNGAIVLAMNLEPCKTYYFFIDGCFGTTCDLSISTSGGRSPMLISPIGLINDIPSQMADVCLGYCDYSFEVDPQPLGCVPYYEWTMDGVPFGGGRNKESWPEFDTEGTFEVCVRAIIGNPLSASQNICDEEGPICLTITVEDEDVITDPNTRYLCNELSGVFKWGDNIVFYPGGTYSHTFNTQTCCIFDSIVTFEVLEKPEEPDVYHASCIKNDFYVDYRGRRHNACGATERVIFDNATQGFQCDSAIILHQFLFDAIARWRIECLLGEIRIIPNLDWTGSCYDRTVAPEVEITYKWYYDQVGAGPVFSTDEEIVITKQARHCLEATFSIKYGDKMIRCTKDMGCEFFREDELIPKAPKLEGVPDTVCLGNTGTYFLDTLLSQRVLFYEWLVDNGELLTKDEYTKDTIVVRWNKAGKARICLKYETDCGISPEKCVDVFVTPGPNPMAGEDTRYCSQLEGQMFGQRGTGGRWSQVKGPGTSIWQDPTDNDSPVSVSEYGTYTYIWTEGSNGCFASDTTVYTFTEAAKPSDVSYTCNGRISYRFSFNMVGKAPFTLIRGNGTLDRNTGIYNSLALPNRTRDSLVVRDGNGCDIIIHYFKDCNCTNSIGTLENQSVSVCQDVSIPYTYDPTAEIRDVGDTVVFLVSLDPNRPFQGTNFIKYLTGNMVTFSPPMMAGVKYYILAVIGKKDGMGGVDRNGNCTQLSNPKQIEFVELPKPLAGADEAVCGSAFTLKGTKSIGLSSMRWQLVNSNGVIITNPNDTNAQLNLRNNVYGTYTFKIIETNRSCTGEDEVNITFNEVPRVDLTDIKCTNDNDPDHPYQVTAKIAGGKAPYTLLQGNGSIGGTNGDEYTSNEYNSLDTFKIVVQDTNGCISEINTGIYSCNCGNNTAGTMPGERLSSCEGQCVNFSVNNDAIIGTGDTTMYILHESNTGILSTQRWDTILSNDTKQVCFMPGMLLGKTYYISRVIGKDASADGVVDNEDPCKRVSVGTPVIWYAYPIANAGKDTSVCARTYNLQATTVAGTGIWRQLSGRNAKIVNPTSPNTRINVSTSGRYNFEWQMSNRGCVAKDTVSVSFIAAPKLLTAPRFECRNNGDVVQFRITIDITDGDVPSYKVDLFNKGNRITGIFLDKDTWRSDWMQNKTGLDLQLSDKFNCDITKLSVAYQCPNDVFSDQSSEDEFSSNGNNNNKSSASKQDLEVSNEHEVWWPNIISPNNTSDARNQRFNVFGKNIQTITELSIYDRWGSQVFTQQNMIANTTEKDGWDGIFKGAPVVPGVYIFLVEVEFLDGDKQQIVGDFTLIR